MRAACGPEISGIGRILHREPFHGSLITRVAFFSDPAARAARSSVPAGLAANRVRRFQAAALFRKIS